jgi:pilus assembly protein Flp/PilA
MIRRFLRDRRGHTAIEYGMIAAMCAIGIITALANMGETTKGSFERLEAGFRPQP